MDYAYMIIQAHKNGMCVDTFENLPINTTFYYKPWSEKPYTKYAKTMATDGDDKFRIYSKTNVFFKRTPKP